ncbi:hypothetical protein [Rhizobium tumorigenes]|uniref:Uncharacterized protein n=2 Tax=Rhizobium tumorigenes TaxID=2041385 RepID=A0AAF1K9U2_9HYPH|nr:hypothetical protein [Rhizobium tumorigenes]WFR97099.1 hypothetical protein PR017_08340 [Rhizobium tumorigenes]
MKNFLTFEEPKNSLLDVPTLVWSQFRDTVENVTKGEAANVSEVWKRLAAALGQAASGSWSGGVLKVRSEWNAGRCMRLVGVYPALNGDEGLIVAYPDRAKEIDCDA